MPGKVVIQVAIVGVIMSVTMNEKKRRCTDLACFCLTARLQCSGGHEAKQLVLVPIWKCSGWLQRGLERGHAACFLLTLVQRTIDTKKKKD